VIATSVQGIDESGIAESVMADRNSSVFLMVNNLEIGGSERQFTNLANSLRHRKFEPLLGCLERKGGFLEQISEIQEFNRGASFYTLQAQRVRFTLAKYLREHKVEVAHAFDFYANVMLIPAARLAGVPVVIGSHRQLGDLLSPMKRRVQGMLFRFCDRVVCNSKAAASRLEDEGYPSNKIVIIPNGISDAAFTRVNPALERIPGKMRVGMIARMNDPCKNHSGFLKTAAILAKRYENVEFVLVGDGPLRESFEQMARELGVADRTVFLGARDDIPAILAALDILILPSRSESLPNIIIEGMAAGMPVVATQVGGIPELVLEGETGFLVAADDEVGMANAVERLLLSAELRAGFGEKAQRLANANYRMSRIRDQFEELYANLLQEKRGPIRASSKEMTS
jgi:glycosyltransferase involved in cell wall biosynthesis